jgi:hypothetical protein
MGKNFPRVKAKHPMEQVCKTNNIQAKKLEMPNMDHLEMMMCNYVSGMTYFVEYTLFVENAKWNDLFC